MTTPIQGQVPKQAALTVKQDIISRDGKFLKHVARLLVLVKNVEVICPPPSEDMVIKGDALA